MRFFSLKKQFFFKNKKKSAEDFLKCAPGKNPKTFSKLPVEMLLNVFFTVQMF